VVVLLSIGCGSQRLQTVSESSERGGAGGVASSNAGASAVAGAGGGSGADFVATELLGLSEFDAMYPVGPVTAEPVAVAGEPFDQAWRATMTQPPSTPLDGQLVAELSRAGVVKDQLLRVTFWLKCEVPRAEGDCYTEYIFERGSSPWEQSVTIPAHSQGSGWTQKRESFRTNTTFQAGEAHMVFRLGFPTQVIAIGGLQLEALDPAP